MVQRIPPPVDDGLAPMNINTVNVHVNPPEKILQLTVEKPALRVAHVLKKIAKHLLNISFFPKAGTAGTIPGGIAFCL